MKCKIGRRYRFLESAPYMPVPSHIVLSGEEDRTLSELRVATTVPQGTRARAHMLRLNAQGWTVPAIAKIFECHEHTVRATLKRWESNGLGGLWEAPGRGAIALMATRGFANCRTVD